MKVKARKPRSATLHWAACAAAMLLGALAAAAGALVPADSAYVRSLDGAWRFKLENPGAGAGRALGDKATPAEPAPAAGFFKLDYREGADWHNLKVPSNWEMAGYSPATYNQPDDASGVYRLWFKVPSSWRGRAVLIQFDGVQNGAEVFCNGIPAPVSESSWGRTNYHEGGWLPFQADVTSMVKFGAKNLIALRVTKKTKSADLDSGDYFFLGGIHRDVTLFSVPQIHLEDLTIQTDLLPDGNAAVRTEVVATEGAAAGYRIAVRLGDTPALRGPVSEGRVDLTNQVAHPRLWSAEHPNLYNITVLLEDSQGDVAETLKRRVGIRQISIENGVYCINHVPVKLTGICRHDVSADLGTAANEDLWRKDITLAKAANVNAIRTSHYPYGPGFYDLCDEMGIYVMDELPYCWSPNGDRSLTPAYEQRARETVRRDKNHACVTLWAIGNEGNAGYNFQVVADLVKKLDPTRPRIVSRFPYTKYHTELSDSHYTVPEEIASAAERGREEKVPHIYLECPNVWDIRLSANDGKDAACWDIWEKVLHRTWDVIWTNDSIPGAFLFEWQDRAVADKCPVKLVHFDAATGISYLKIKGVVDGYRHPRPQYYHIKMIYSPIQAASKLSALDPNGVSVLVTNRYSFTDLSELDMRWTLLKGGKKVASGLAHAPLAARSSGLVRLALPEASLARSEELRVDFDHAGGRNVVSHLFRLRDVPMEHEMLAPLPPNVTFPKLNLVVNRTVRDPHMWRRVDRYHGKLANIRVQPDSTQGLFTRPLTGIKSLDADIQFDNQPKWKGRVHATFENGRFAYRVDWDGAKAEIQELGWIFSMPKKFDHFSWKREAVWSVYPKDHIGRPEGTATPDSAKVHILDWSRPDAFDFDSTKYDCDWASLTDSRGAGLRVVFDPSQRQQCRGGFAPGGGYSLIVNRQTNPPQDISSRQVRDLFLTFFAGDSIEGAFQAGGKPR